MRLEMVLLVINCHAWLSPCKLDDIIRYSIRTLDRFISLVSARKRANEWAARDPYSVDRSTTSERSLI